MKKSTEEYLKENNELADFKRAVVLNDLQSIYSIVEDFVDSEVKNCSIPLVMPCTSFEHTAVDLKDGSTAVWTDGLSLNSDNDRHCHYKLEEGQKYKVVVCKA